MTTLDELYAGLGEALRERRELSKALHAADRLTVAWKGRAERAEAELNRLHEHSRLNERAHEKLIDKLMTHIPDDSWESGEGSAESLVEEYVAAVTARLRALVGDVGMVRFPEDRDSAPLPDAVTSPEAYRNTVPRATS